ncbi:MAG: HAMP domain-containing sensor histidine kinase [Tenuifilaceae bacterium]|jgi:signal transduction histidine kinase|nr:HAMP domain-containing sensor histidine kinase [Tenuifilaceae bacterium]
MSPLSRIINLGINEEGDFDLRRKFRQVNEFNLGLAFITLISLPIAIWHQVYFGVVVQLLGLSAYSTGFYLVSKGKLELAKRLAISTFEVQILLVSLFAVYPTSLEYLPWYSPLFVVFMTFPITAALFDKSIPMHVLVAFAFIVGIQFTGNLPDLLGVNRFPSDKIDILNLIVSVFTILISSITIYLITWENHTVKVLEIRRRKQLQKAYNDIECSHKQIKQQAQELQEMNQTKNRLFTIISHDLKSPFNIVLGFSELLKNKSKDNPEYYKFAKYIHDSALNNYVLLENLLEWSRLQIDKVKENPVAFEIEAIAAQNVALVAVTAEKKEITIDMNIDKNLMVWGDKNSVSIVIRNLVTNALKFTRAGGKISISAAEKNSMIEISVKDNGIGLSASQVKELFNLEKKKSRLGTSNELGTGLGLFLCKEIIEKNGGKIWVESEENVGTSFSFNLPKPVL